MVPCTLHTFLSGSFNLVKFSSGALYSAYLYLAVITWRDSVLVPSTLHIFINSCNLVIVSSSALYCVYLFTLHCELVILSSGALYSAYFFVAVAL